MPSGPILWTADEWNYGICIVFVGVVEYMDVWKKFDGAGTHLVDSLCNSLCDSDYQHLGLETSQAFNVIYASSNGIDPSGKLREIEKLLIGLRSHLESVENVEKTKSHLQVNFNFILTHVLQFCNTGKCDYLLVHALCIDYQWDISLHLHVKLFWFWVLFSSVV